MPIKYTLIAVIDGIPLGNWDGRFICTDKINFWEERDADIELKNYRSRLLYRYDPKVTVLKAVVNFDWNLMQIYHKSKKNRSNKKSIVTVGK